MISTRLRMIARATSRHPLLLLTVWLLIGQLIGEITQDNLWHLIGIIALLGWIPKRYIIAMVIGIASILLALPDDNQTIPNTKNAEVIGRIISLTFNQPGGVRFVLESDTNNHTKILGRVADLPWSAAGKLHVGANVFAKGRCLPVLHSNNPFDYTNSLRRDGISTKCYFKYVHILKYGAPDLRSHIVDFVLSQLQSQEAAGMLLAMSFGVRNLISRQTEELYKKTGLMHILVVSGYQLMLFYGLMQLIVRRFHSAKLQLLMPLSVTTLFLWLVDFESSAVRAWLAIVYHVVGKHLNFMHGTANAVIFSLFVSQLLEPGSFLEPGCQLTFAALFGIVLATPTERWITDPILPSFRRELVQTFYNYLQLGTLIWLATGVIVLFWFRTLSLTGLALNLVFGPLLAVLGCHAAIIGMLFAYCGVPHLLQFCGWFISACTDLLEHLDILFVMLSPDVLPLIILLLLVAAAMRLRRYAVVPC